MDEPVSEVKPFPVDPEVMAAIRPMQARDLSRVVALHRAAMGTSLWARLGTPFLMSLYRHLLELPEFIGFVYEEKGRVRGFIAGSSNASSLFGSLARLRPADLLQATLHGVLLDPRVLVPLAQTAAYFRRSALSDEDIPAESMFCSFEPDLRGKRISGHINKVLFDELFFRGCEKVKITTEADNEGAVRQLSSWGFIRAKAFRFYDKEMLTFVLDLKNSPRVERIQRLRAPAF